MTGGSWSLSLGLRLAGQLLSPGNLRPSKANPTDQTAQVLAYGTSDDQITQIVLQTRTLGAGASEELDLYDGSNNSPAMVDIVSEVAAFRVLRSFVLWIDDGGDDSGVTVGAAASNANNLWLGGTAPTQTVYSGGAPMCGGGDVGVTVSTSARYVKVANNGAAAVTYTVAMAGSTVSSGVAMGVLGLTYP